MIQFDNAVERLRKVILDELDEADIRFWIAGGAVRDYFMAVPRSTDYDIFFESTEEYNKAYNYFIDKNAEKKWESDNGCKLVHNKKTYDLVKHFFPGPQECIDGFDFTVSMLAVDMGKVYHGPSTFIDLSKRQLMLNKLPLPASTLSRAFRYYTKGFRMCKGEMKLLCEAIQNMPKEEKEPAEGEDIEQQTSGFFLGID